jgi:hypothetical protein
VAALIALAFRKEVGALTDADGMPVLDAPTDEARFVWLALGIVPDLGRPETVEEMHRLIDEALRLRAEDPFWTAR